jgi:hypothetical protein
MRQCTERNREPMVKHRIHGAAAQAAPKCEVKRLVSAKAREMSRLRMRHDDSLMWAVNWPFRSGAMGGGLERLLRSGANAKGLA